MAHWFTSDLHFGHEKIIRLCRRPFPSVSEMNRVLLDRLWERVGPEDDLWILGDLAMGPGTRDRDWLQGLFGELPGARRHLVPGNHDHDRIFALPWDTVSPLVELRDPEAGFRFTLCHYPMITWNGARNGALQLFGHVHENWLGTRNAVNVGVDVWDFRPVSAQEILRRAQTLPINRHWDDVEPKAPLEKTREEGIGIAPA